MVLGGAIRPGLDVDPMSRLHRGSDRIAVAAALFDAGCAPLIFVAAGGRYELPVVESEAVSIAHFLQRLGVPSRNILIDSLSRNTAQNAEQSWAGLSGQGARDIILVTSAWHLPRAILEFESVGFSVRPFGADYRGYLSGSEPLGGWWPDAGALLLSHVALKERLGLLVQRLR